MRGSGCARKVVELNVVKEFGCRIGYGRWQFSGLGGSVVDGFVRTGRRSEMDPRWFSGLRVASSEANCGFGSAVMDPSGRWGLLFVGR